MNEPSVFLLAKLAQECAALRQCISDLDRAMIACQEAKRESLEVLADVEATLGAMRDAANGN